MIKKLLIMLAALTAAVWLGVRVANDPGYVLFAYANWTIEMPLWVFAIMFLLLLWVGYFMLRALHGLRFSGRAWRRWRSHKHLALALKHLEQGLLAFAEGDIVVTEREFKKAAAHDPAAGSGYLLLSEMALQQHQPQAAARFLEQAEIIVPNAQFALAFSRARVLAQKAKESAIDIVTQLRQSHPKQQGLVQFLLEHYQQTKQWQAYIELLPMARKLKMLDKTQYAQAEQQAYQALMAMYREQGQWQAMLASWLEMPRALHHDVSLVVNYCRALSATSNSATAEKLLKREIKKQFDSRLVVCYSELEGIDPEQKLKLAEKWVPYHPNDADLLMVCGQLCSEQRLWGKARDYLQQAMDLRMDKQVCAALGFVLEQFKETHAAMDIYRQGLQC